MGKRVYSCHHCRKKATLPDYPAPLCCEALMIAGGFDDAAPMSDPEEHRLHFIKLRRDPLVEFEGPNGLAIGRPFQTLEVWDLKGGSRAKGERFGWLGFYKAGIAWRMEKGIGGPYAKGFQPLPAGADVQEAIDVCARQVMQIMTLAIQGGEADKRMIREILAS